MEVIGPLSDPPATGKGGDAFHVVVPVAPRLCLSDKPVETGWDVNRIAQRLGDADATPWLRALGGAGRRLGGGVTARPGGISGPGV